MTAAFSVVALAPAGSAVPLEGLVRKMMQETWPAGKSPAASGFYVSKDGLVLTNAHAVGGCKSILAGPKGDAAPATLVDFDPASDTALVRTGRPAPAVLPFANAPAKGHAVRVFSMSFGADGAATPAQMLAVADGTQPAGRINLLKLKRLQRKLVDGSSGGPVVDASGRVIGMVVGRYSGGPNEAVAVPSVRLSGFLRDHGAGPARAGRKPVPDAQIKAALAEVRCQ